MLWAGLAAVGWPAAEQRLEAKFDVALFQDALDCPLAQLAGQGEDGCDCVPQMSVSFLHPVELARLIRGRSLGSPAADLLRVDVHEFQLLGMNPVDAVNGSVVNHVRALTVARLGQSLDERTRVLDGLVDHAGDEGHFADRLPVHWIGMRHAGLPLYALHAKSSPALAPQFIACNTPRQIITLRAISIARNDCTQETARSRWRDAGKDQIGPKNWENAIEGPSLPCNFTPMGLPTHLGDVGLVIERVWWQRSRAGHARRSETPAAPNNAAPIDRRRPR